MSDRTAAAPDHPTTHDSRLTACPEFNEGTHDWTHGEATPNGVRLHYVEAGAGPGGTAPPVILLHGFPEFWYSWRHQLPALAAAGFRALAPDLRGYNLSGRPPGVRPYRIGALIGDVVGLIAHAGAARAVLVGHDWGGLIAWYAAMYLPDVVERLVVLNAPHPALFARELRNPGQLVRSSYQFFFQLPRLPEAALRARDYAVVRRTLRDDPVHPDAFTAGDIARYVEALDRPGALTATINYYRAAYRRDPRRALRELREIRPVAVPTLLIWGERDRFLGPGLTRGLDRWAPDLRVERIPDASHWVQNDAPERVNAALLAFLRERAGAG